MIKMICYPDMPNQFCLLYSYDRFNQELDSDYLQLKGMCHPIGILVMAFTMISTNCQTKKYMNADQYTFEWFINAFGKSYNFPNQRSTAKIIYQNNLANIIAHNANPNNTYRKGINQFTDQVNITNNMQTPTNSTLTFEDIEIQAAPSSEEIDWVEKGMVTSVKNQFKCQGCYAFATIAALESAILIANQGQTDLSQQQVIDCSDNHGCISGTVPKSFQYMMDHYIVSELDYPFDTTLTPFHYRQNPYDRNPASKCQINNNSILINGTNQTIRGRSYRIKNYVDINNCNQLEKALSITPVVVLINAENWQFYQSGIFADCKGFSPNHMAKVHAVLLVAATQQYWTIKNSWGTSWGMSGYMQLARGNTCGICQYPSYPVYK